MDAGQRRAFAAAGGLEEADRRDLYASIWKEYLPRLAVYLRSFRALSEEDREELAADALGRAFSRSGLYDPGRPFEPWLWTIARALALNALSSRRSRDAEETGRSEGIDEEPDARRPGPEEDCVAGEERRAVASFLSCLPERERELARLVYGDGMKLKEAAAVTGEPLGTVKWRVSAIKKGLKAAWRDRGEG